MKWLIVVLLITFSGCRLTRDKASVQQAKIGIAFPEIPARYCADKYPPKNSTDSVFTSDSSKYKEIVEELQGDLYSSNVLIDSLLSALANGDTTCRKYASVIMALQQQLISLKQKVITIPPVTTHTEKINTVVNTAEVDFWKTQSTNAIGLATDKTKEADKWKRIAKKRFWIIAGMGAAMALGIFVALRRKVVKKVSPL